MLPVEAIHDDYVIPNCAEVELQRSISEQISEDGLLHSEIRFVGSSTSNNSAECTYNRFSLTLQAG